MTYGAVNQKRGEMAMRMIRLLLFITLFRLIAGPAFAAGKDLPVYPVKGKVVARLSIFDNPEGSIVSMDGNFLFVSNFVLQKRPGLFTLPRAAER